MSSASRYAADHVDPKGPGDARPTAQSIIEDEGLAGKLTDKVILITGCTSGLGLETARALHATGAHIFITARDLKKADEAVRDLQSGGGPGQGKLDVLKLDLGSLKSVCECAADFLSKSKQLNILINNAGVMACPEGRTEDGFETQLGTNHLAHFLLFELLKPALLDSSTPQFHSRVVALSSGAHRISPVHLDDLDLKKGGYDPWKAYGQSKTANIHMATEIERRYGHRGLHASAVHPGIIRTALWRHTPQQATGANQQTDLRLKSPEQGAATTVWAAVSKDLEGKGGNYLEDCSVSGPRSVGELTSSNPRYAPYAFDAKTACGLWVASLRMVGLGADESGC